MAEQDKTPNLLERVISKIRELIRKVYGLKFSDIDIANLLAKNKSVLKSQPKPDDFDSYNFKCTKKGWKGKM